MPETHSSYLAILSMVKSQAIDRSQREPQDYCLGFHLNRKHRGFSPFPINAQFSVAAETERQ